MNYDYKIYRVEVFVDPSTASDRDLDNSRRVNGHVFASSFYELWSNEQIGGVEELLGDEEELVTELRSRGVRGFRTIDAPRQTSDQDSTYLYSPLTPEESGRILSALQQ